MNETRIAEIRALVVALAESGPEPAKGPHETYGQRLLVAFSEQADVAAAALTELLGEVERLTAVVKIEVEWREKAITRAEAAEAKLGKAKAAVQTAVAALAWFAPGSDTYNAVKQSLSELES